ncbi:hydantoinase B/oxoprolinase family protein [Roseomonas sp. E05]|uniref:hydantoinase B/oxoprolinase family protein n=1 Tax=Roseomonas sp. E05 TaxID=3046310 RepID=UPI0024BA5824|nr:hydantoinase B/oxoprolinase family protein [Roseomonas sp. E05]MDJ0388771.1 hydantoinase B/oxoprolinase family protein [Roseomonas sp. E05]
MSLDPITVEVVRHKLDGIANEMQSTLLRSSFSPIVKEGLDASAGLFTAEGVTLSQACAIPIHLATLIPMVRKVIETFPVAEMRAGDTFLLNDPYEGGTHLPDIALIQPILVEGRLIAFSAALTHHQDMGGMIAGSVPTNSTEIYQEGLRLPPLRYREDGRVNETLVRILRSNVRIPDTVMGDVNAQMAACSVGARRLAALAGRYGAEHLTAIFADLLDRSEIMTRQALARIPEGTYRAVDWLDNDGVDLDRPIRLEVAVTLRDRAIHLDFTGTSPQVRGPLNCVPSGTLAAACFAIRALTDSSIPTNGGCFRPISLHIPEGTILNPREPAAVNARTATIKRVAGMILAAFAEVMPERVPAASAGEMVMLTFGGQRGDGSQFVTGDQIAGGSGAARGSDGVDVIETDATNGMNLPAEAMEMETPIRLNRVTLRPGSGGAGTWRGGLGTIREYEVLGEDVAVSYRGERHFSAARGVAGGADGAMARGTILRADGSTEVIRSKIVTRMRRGDRILVETAGGAGYGPPAERDAAAGEADRRNGKTTV